MDYLIDTNVFLDVFLKREGLYENPKKILKLCENKKINGFITASSVTDIYYILRRYLKNSEKAYLYLGYVLELVSVIDVKKEDVIKAYQLRAKDFEDCLAYTCAKRSKMAGIISRNVKDFKDFAIKSLSPDDFIKAYDKNGAVAKL